MSSANRIHDLLQDGPASAVDQSGVTDKVLLEQNAALRDELAVLRIRLVEAERMADMDPLLNVFNRRAFMREIGRAQSVADRYDVMSCVIFFDLDGFKSINDAFGHAAGDEMLVRVAEALTSGVRACDMVARLGGDEFGILLFKSEPEVARAKAAALACRIGEVRVPHPDDVFTSGEIGIQASWGTASCEPGQTADNILERADREMYLRKRGRL